MWNVLGEKLWCSVGEPVGNERKRFYMEKTSGRETLPAKIPSGRCPFSWYIPSGIPDLIGRGIGNFFFVENRPPVLKEGPKLPQTPQMGEPVDSPPQCPKKPVFKSEFPVPKSVKCGKVSPLWNQETLLWGCGLSKVENETFVWETCGWKYKNPSFGVGLSQLGNMFLLGKQSARGWKKSLPM